MFSDVTVHTSPFLLCFLCHSREYGNPDSINTGLDSRLRGNDRVGVNSYFRIMLYFYKTISCAILTIRIF